ncbi:MAG: hypothetical protein IJ588_08790 [Prevotella sp.]|nr:hypothetical protein [Prevotella sp.]
MIKTYILTRPYHNYSFILRHKSGMKLRYDFTGGNSITNTKAQLILRGQFAQELLESSDEFKTGLVRLFRTEDGGESVPSVVVSQQPTIVEEVTSPEQLIEYVAEKLEKVYLRPDAALEYAKRKGFQFPNLELKKKEE